MRSPKSVWIIFDPLDGLHIFRSRKQAVTTYAQWKRAAKDNTYDSFWDMSEPVEYKLGKSK